MKRFNVVLTARRRHSKPRDCSQKPLRGGGILPRTIRIDIGRQGRTCSPCKKKYTSPTPIWPPKPTATNRIPTPIPFQGKQSYGMPSDFVVPNILNIEDTDERLWVCRPSHILAAQSEPADRNSGPSSTLRLYPSAPLWHIPRILCQHPTCQAVRDLKSA
jgi:hypothetical protein